MHQFSGKNSFRKCNIRLLGLDDSLCSNHNFQKLILPMKRAHKKPPKLSKKFFSKICHLRLFVIKRQCCETSLLSYSTRIAIFLRTFNFLSLFIYIEASWQNWWVDSVFYLIEPPSLLSDIYICKNAYIRCVY